MLPSYYDPTCIDEQPVPLPSASPVILAHNVILQPPLTRRARGPGLVIFLPSLDSFSVAGRATKSLDPEPVQKWAEEGFAVVAVTAGCEWSTDDTLSKAAEALVHTDEVDIKNKFGIIVYDPEMLQPILDIVSTESRVVCVVSYGAHSTGSSLAFLSHVPSQYMPSNVKKINCHEYSTSSQFFVFPSAAEYHKGSATVAHARSLAFLREHIGGPHFDLDAIWEEHTFFEFAVRNLAKTMGTMVAEPYINCIPTMTGGVGRKNVTSFYRDHFIFLNPADTALELVSRTVGADRIVDEFVLTMTHDTVVDWLLPGVPPSGRTLALPMLSVVNVRGDRLSSEHIWWDQGTALLQAGVIPIHVPHPLPGGKRSIRLPIAGAETARLLADETSAGSNIMFDKDWPTSGL